MTVPFVIQRETRAQSQLNFGINQEMITRTVSDGRSQVFGIPRSRSHALTLRVTIPVSQPQFLALVRK
jgi:hypothetical protein